MFSSKTLIEYMRHCVPELLMCEQKSDRVHLSIPCVFHCINSNLHCHAWNPIALSVWFTWDVQRRSEYTEQQFQFALYLSTRTLLQDRKRLSAILIKVSAACWVLENITYGSYVALSILDMNAPGAVNYKG